MASLQAFLSFPPRATHVLSRAQIPPSPFPLNAFHAGYVNTTSYIFPFSKGCKRVASLSNENAAILAVMNSNRKFVCFCMFTLVVLQGKVIESDRLKRERINFQLLFLTCGTSTYSLLKLSYNYIRVTYHKHTSLYTTIMRESLSLASMYKKFQSFRAKPNFKIQIKMWKIMRYGYLTLLLRSQERMIIFCKWPGVPVPFPYSKRIFFVEQRCPP